ncbi:MAG: hypothetical protein IKN87_04115 [Bacilli bacterium]|nr:hypothetical protein [Bacilli bacterium]
MKRKNKKVSIIIAILLILIAVVAILLITALLNKNNNNKKEDKKLTIACGESKEKRDQALCNRYFEPGYVVTFKEKTDLNVKYDLVNNLQSSINNPVVFITGDEQIEILTNNNVKTDDLKLDDVMYIPSGENYNKDLTYEKLVKEVKKFDKLYKVYSYSGLVEK